MSFVVPAYRSHESQLGVKSKKAQQQSLDPSATDSDYICMVFCMPRHEREIANISFLSVTSHNLLPHNQEIMIVGSSNVSIARGYTFGNGVFL